MSNHQANIVHTTKKLLNGIYLLDKIKNCVKRFLERIIKVEQIDSNDIQVKEINRLFKVKSCSKETFHQLDLGDKCSFPTCTCHDWKKHLVLYKHSLALFEHKADTSTVYPAADNYVVSTDISLSEEKPGENNISVENYRELQLSKQKCKTDFDCREILEQLKSLTITITDTAALKELKEN